MLTLPPGGRGVAVTTSNDNRKTTEVAKPRIGMNCLSAGGVTLPDSAAVTQLPVETDIPSTDQLQDVSSDDVGEAKHIADYSIVQITGTGVSSVAPACGSDTARVLLEYDKSVDDQGTSSDFFKDSAYESSLPINSFTPALQCDYVSLPHLTSLTVTQFVDV